MSQWYTKATETSDPVQNTIIGKKIIAYLLIGLFLYDILTNLSWTLRGANTGLGIGIGFLLAVFLSFSEFLTGFAWGFAKSQKGHSISGPIAWLLVLFLVLSIGVDIYASIVPITDSLANVPDPISHYSVIIIAAAFSLLSSIAQVALLPTLKEATLIK